ncbi:hypothetical protein [Empedobacter falsenii]|uniref:hypothetical protein n=2 Tax=Empedobacter TaxID=59734 RepID=UPI000570D208|nr:hypothetical protein [Empedobacter falsenii]
MSELYSNYMNKYIKKHIDRVPQGKTRITFIISKEGKIENLGYSDYNNEKFAKFSLYILQEIKNDFDKYNITFNPIKNQNQEVIDYNFSLPISLKIE